jgi:hypothetical protein
LVAAFGPVQALPGADAPAAVAAACARWIRRRAAIADEIGVAAKLPDRFPKSLDVGVVLLQRAAVLIRAQSRVVREHAELNRH